MLWRFLRSLRVALDRGPGWDRCYHSRCSIRPRGIWGYPVRPQSAPRRHVGEGRGVDHTGIYIVVTMQARTRLQTQSKDTRVRRCMHAQDPDRDPCTCHKVCRSATVTPPRRQTMRQGGSLQLCCGAAHTESTCYTACIHIRFWPLHGPLTGLGSSAAVQTVANRRSRRCGRAGVESRQAWSGSPQGGALRGWLCTEWVHVQGAGSPPVLREWLCVLLMQGANACC